MCFDMTITRLCKLILLLSCWGTPLVAQQAGTTDFNRNWKFILGNKPGAYAVELRDNNWRKLDLPHDWGVEGKFSKLHPATFSGGALPGGVGWYRKHFKCLLRSKENMLP
jgi:beta-galactosidase